MVLTLILIIRIEVLKNIIIIMMIIIMIIIVIIIFSRSWNKFTSFLVYFDVNMLKS